jgi:hypothetical protein
MMPLAMLVTVNTVMHASSTILFFALLELHVVVPKEHKFYYFRSRILGQ